MEGLSLCSDHQVARTQRSLGLKRNFFVLDHHDNKCRVQVLRRGMMEDHRRRGLVQALTPLMVMNNGGIFHFVSLFL